MIFITNVEPMLDKNVRLAANHAIDKKAIVEQLLRGYGVPIDTLEAPEYAAFDPSIKVPYDPDLASKLLARQRLLAAEAGQVHDPDDARLQAEGLRNDPGDRRHVAQGRHRSQHRGLRDRQALRAAHQPQAGAGWRSTTGAMRSAIRRPRPGFAMFGPSPHSSWKSKDLDAMIGPLWGEKDEAKRIAGYKAVDRYIAKRAT